MLILKEEQMIVSFLAGDYEFTGCKSRDSSDSGWQQPLIGWQLLGSW